MKLCRRDGGGSAATLKLLTEFFVRKREHAAIGMVDEHELFCAQFVMRDEQRADDVVRDDAAGVAKNMRVTHVEAQGADAETRVHAGDDDYRSEEHTSELQSR